jgi:hypothetical protein
MSPIVHHYRIISSHVNLRNATPFSIEETQRLDETRRGIETALLNPWKRIGETHSSWVTVIVVVVVVVVVSLACQSKEEEEEEEEREGDENENEDLSGFRSQGGCSCELCCCFCCCYFGVGADGF